MQGGVGNRPAAAASHIHSAADNLGRKADALCSAAHIYLEQEEELEAKAQNTTRTIKTGYDLSLLGGPVSKAIFSKEMITKGSVLSGVLKEGTFKAKSGSAIKAEKTLESEAVKVKDNLVDKYREMDGNSGKKTTNKSVVYGSKKTKLISGILPGNSYQVTTYHDYKTATASNTKGRDFFDADAGLTIQGQHIEVESNDNTKITIDTNAVYGNMKGSLDPLKGNAYVSAGAEYDAVKINLVDTEDRCINTGLSVQAGVGAKINAGFHDGKFTADASASLLLGVEVKLEVDYQKIWHNFKTDFLNLPDKDLGGMGGR